MNKHCCLKKEIFQAGNGLYLKSLRVISNFTETAILYLNEC